VVIYAYNHHVRLLLPNLWSSTNHSLLGSRSRHCYAIIEDRADFSGNRVSQAVASFEDNMFAAVGIFFQ
jgi:hypothetical protein